MCGISGVFNPSLTSQGARQLVDAMLGTIRHRGPDSSGIFQDNPVVLGHNRLKVIDLSDDANQPMEYGDLVITYNGEVYNFPELRNELVSLGYLFRTQSDTEVVVAAFRQWGESCVEHFIGMWAFAIWDRTRRSLFCSTDRFGIKPFYYINTNGNFYFASEYKPLKLVPDFSKDLNYDQIFRGLQLGWLTYEGQTYFECIHRLPAAHNLTYDERNGLKITRYWDIYHRQKLNGQFDNRAETFRELFKDSVRIHNRSDVKVGACLSGGIDSSSIVSVLAEMYPEQEINSFNIYYTGKDAVDERPWMLEVPKKFSNVNPHSYTPTNDELWDAFEQTQYYADVPLSGSSPVSQYLVMREAARQGCKVMLDGQGSDEYLAGYKHSFHRFLGAQIRSVNLLNAYRNLRSYRQLQNQSVVGTLTSTIHSMHCFLQDEESKLQLEFRYANPYSIRNLKGFPFALRQDPALNSFDVHLYHLVFNTSLPTLLLYEDRNSMAFSIESRVPFLDHRLVEYAFALNENDKIYKGEAKYILRKAMKGILPDKITNRQDKQPFTTPGNTVWLRGPLKKLLESDFGKLDFLNLPMVRSIISDFKKGEDKNSRLIWRLASLNHWIEANA